MEHRKKARLTPVKELILEKQRLDLLASRKPKEVKMGEKMVTPGSIFAKLASFQDIAETESQAVLAAEEAEDAEEAQGGQEPVFGPEGHPLRGGNVLALHLQKATKKGPVRKPAQQMTEVWLPLTFPEVPAKGDFDVRVLRDSPYFFN